MDPDPYQCIWINNTALKEPDPKRYRYSFESVLLNMIIKQMLLVLSVFGRFYGSGFDPDFLPIRIRTQEKKSDQDPEKNPDPKH